MAEVAFSTLGWVYIGLTTAWTVILLGGMIFLWRHRKLPFLQIRRLPLIFSAIVLLHIYGASCMAGFTIFPVVPCDAQFWVMSIYLPYGMALLQAANSQFLHIASQQKKYATFGKLEEAALSEKSREIDPSASLWKRTWQRIQKMDQTNRVVFWISVGMVVELILTAIIYFGSEMFHPSYGFFNAQVPGTEAVRAQLCFTGWEWWLSIVWQFFWSWIYAPYMLWKTRNIRDTSGWRVQTIGCCIAGLFPSPLWLAHLYIPGMAAINSVMVPPMWYAYSIFFIEIFLIFFPCWQVIKTHSLQQETIAAISSWEQRNKHPSPAADGMSASTVAGTTLAGASIGGASGKTDDSGSSRKSDMFTMVALENALRHNPQPLLEFAALKDFSGENVSFLTHISEWKRSWALLKGDTAVNRKQFIRAVQIYSHFISLQYSEFPVNISSRSAKELHRIFDDAAHLLNRRRSTQSDSATPFDEYASEISDTESGSPFDLERTLGKANLDAVTHMTELSGDQGHDITVSSSFHPQVLDAAEEEIKYLVLTNTWPKFVLAGLDNSSHTLSDEKPRAMAKLKTLLRGKA